MSSFSFRQRAGSVDWRAVSSVNVDEVVLNANTKLLQNVLDTVTFCEFTPNDVKNNTIENVSKFVSILQLISEYLLRCQEFQFKGINTLQSKYEKSREHIDRLKKETLSLKEDRKIYQRQLALLRKLAGPEQVLKSMADAEGDRMTPRILNLFNPTSVRSSSQAQDNSGYNKSIPTADVDVVASILKHEEETRLFMTSLLDDQRRTFLEQIQLMTDAAATSASTNSNKIRQSREESSLSTAEYLGKFKNQMESTVQAAVEAMQTTIQQSLANMAEEQRKVSQTVPASLAGLRSSLQQNKDAGSVLQEAALEEFEKELNIKERHLEEREQSLLSRERDFITSSNKASTRHRASDEERLSLLASKEALTLSAQSVAVRTIRTIVQIVFLRKKTRAFRKWVTMVQSVREVEVGNEQARLLVYAKEQRTIRETELAQQLEMEKEKGVVAQAKQNSLLRALDAAETKLAELSAGSGLQGERERELETQLQREREISVIASAKFNTLKMKNDAQINSLQSQLTQLEEVLAKERIKQESNNSTRPLASTSATKESSVMTSMEFPSSNATAIKLPSVGGGPLATTATAATSPPSPAKLLLRQSLQRQYVHSDANEQDLFDKVQRKLAGRKTAEEIEAEAMASLAVEINSRMTSDAEGGGGSDSSSTMY